MAYPIVVQQALPSAKEVSIYNIATIEKKLEKLGKEHAPMRALYERMIEKGSNRFAVKPSHLPSIDRLLSLFPNFREPLEDIRRHLALCVDSSDPLEIPPMLFLGPPGIGKTHFAKGVAGLFQTGFGFASMSSTTAGWILSGASSQWKGARPGKIFETLVDGIYANPVFVIDEIDKARGEHAYDPLGSLYDLLEYETAMMFTDEFAEVPIDARWMIWFATANDERSIPEPILNRMQVYSIDYPDPLGMRTIIRTLYHELREEHEWGKKFPEFPSERIVEKLTPVSPRAIRSALRTGFGNAALAKRNEVLSEDIPIQKEKPSIGFIQ